MDEKEKVANELIEKLHMSLKLNIANHVRQWSKKYPNICIASLTTTSVAQLLISCFFLNCRDKNKKVNEKLFTELVNAVLNSVERNISANALEEGITWKREHGTKNNRD